MWLSGLDTDQPFVRIAPSVKLDYADGGSVYAEYEHHYVREYFGRA